MHERKLWNHPYAECLRLFLGVNFRNSDKLVRIQLKQNAATLSRTGSATGMITKRVLRQLHSGDKTHSNDGIVKENQMAYDHIFGMNLSPQVHSSRHSGWHPITWLKGHGYWPLDGYMHLSVFPLACGAHEHGRHCKTVWSVAHNWRHGASSARVPTFCAFFPTQDGVTCDQFGMPGGTLKLIASSQKRIYNVPNWQPPPKSVDHPYA